MKPETRTLLLDGTSIPAHPLALNKRRTMDERRQRALSRYYLESGAGGIAVGVHTTQFAIHRKEVGLYEPVLRIAMEECRNFESTHKERVIVKVAGIIGNTHQASNEALLAVDLGYDAGLLGLSALRDRTEREIIQHCVEVSKTIPLFGFYLQPAVGGMALPYSFWRRFVEIENVVAIKVATFNRYQTLDVVRAVMEAGRNDIALYTGNDDHIVLDLISRHELGRSRRPKRLFDGGLLGHWAVWTRAAVRQFEAIKELRDTGDSVPSSILETAIQVTDCNAAFFDASNGFKGCIPGIHEVLKRQGLLEGTTCLDPEEQLSRGQSEEIDRVYECYPHLNDDGFVKENIDRWLS